MYYINTDPNLLGKHKFGVSKTITTKKAFKENLKSIIEEIGKLNPEYTYENPNWNKTNDERELTKEIEYFMSSSGLYDPIVYPNGKKFIIPQRLKSLVELFCGSHGELKGGITFGNLDVYTYQEQLVGDEYKDSGKLKILNNFPYIQTYSASTECAFCKTASIIYFDDKEDLNLYIPTYGNTMNLDLDLAFADWMQAWDEFALKFEDWVEKVPKKYKKPITTFEGMDVSKLDDSFKNMITIFEYYKEKYGIVKCRHNKYSPTNTTIEYFDDLVPGFFLVSKRRIKKDIASNII